MHAGFYCSFIHFNMNILFKTLSTFSVKPTQEAWLLTILFNRLIQARLFYSLVCVFLKSWYHQVFLCLHVFVLAGLKIKKYLMVYIIRCPLLSFFHLQIRMVQMICKIQSHLSLLGQKVSSKLRLGDGGHPSTAHSALWKHAALL